MGKRKFLMRVGDIISKIKSSRENKSRQLLGSNKVYEFSDNLSKVFDVDLILLLKFFNNFEPWSHNEFLKT